MPLYSIFFVQKSFNYKPFFNILRHEKKIELWMAHTCHHVCAQAHA